LLRRVLVPWKQKTRGLVLAYHSVRYAPEDVFSITPEAFERQCEMIRADGFTVVPLSTIEHMLAREVPARTIVITFDDGRRDNYEYAFPILKRFGYHATVFSITDCIGGSIPTSSGPVPALSVDQMKEMQQSGLIDFEPHTASHTSLTQVPLSEAREQVSRSKSTLERMLSKPCPYFSYPHGKYSGDIQKILADSGIRLAFSTASGFVTPQSDTLALERNGVDRTTTGAEFRGILAHGRIR